VTIVILYRIFGRRRRARRKLFRFGQVISSGALSVAHGANDAQKTMA